MSVNQVGNQSNPYAQPIREGKISKSKSRKFGTTFQIDKGPLRSAFRNKERDEASSYKFMRFLERDEDIRFVITEYRFQKAPTNWKNIQNIYNKRRLNAKNKNEESIRNLTIRLEGLISQAATQKTNETVQVDMAKCAHLLSRCFQRSSFETLNLLEEGSKEQIKEHVGLLQQRGILIHTYRTLFNKWGETALPNLIVKLKQFYEDMYHPVALCDSNVLFNFRERFRSLRDLFQVYHTQFAEVEHLQVLRREAEFHFLRAELHLLKESVKVASAACPVYVAEIRVKKEQLECAQEELHKCLNLSMLNNWQLELGESIKEAQYLIVISELNIQCVDIQLMCFDFMENGFKQFDDEKLYLIRDKVMQLLQERKDFFSVKVPAVRVEFEHFEHIFGNYFEKKCQKLKELTSEKEQKLLFSADNATMISTMKEIIQLRDFLLQHKSRTANAAFKELIDTADFVLKKAAFKQLVSFK